MPPEYAQVLEKSLDDCPPSSPRHVMETVEEQLRETPFGRRFYQKEGRPVTCQDVFQGFDPAAPIASASIAQVHVATLKSSGRKVVLKIQHPGVRPMLLQDLEDLKTLLRVIAGAEPKYDMRPVLDAWIDMVPLETSFLNEMANLQAVRTALEKTPDHLKTTAYVPEPLPDLTSDKLFVMEYIDGAKVNDLHTLDTFNVDKTALIQQITKSFGCQLFVSNVFSGDPHPGNFLVHQLNHGGVPVLLDFGICVTVTQAIRVGFAKLVLSAIDNDSYSLIQSLADIGVKINRTDPAASLDIIKFLFRNTSPRQQSVKEMNSMRVRMEENEEKMKKNVNDMAINDVFSTDTDAANIQKKRQSRSPIDSFPGDLVFFIRSLGMLRGLAVTLDVRHSYLDTLRPYAEYIMRGTCPKEERLKETVYKPLFTNGGKAVAVERALKKVFEMMYKMDMMIGMQVSAYKDGQLVLNMASGRMGKYNQRPVKLDSIFNSFSATKGLTAILFASIQDSHGVEYNDLVTKYWPEFGQNGKEDTTIEHILSHSCGLAAALPEDMAMVRMRDDWEGIIRYLEQATPAHPPGERTEYHALTFGWLVAGLIHKITGKTYQQLLDSLKRKLDIEHECFCGAMPQHLLLDVPESRIASLSSSIFTDLQQGPLATYMKKMNKKRSNSEDGTDETGEEEGGEGVDFEDAAAKMGDLEGQTERALKKLNFPASGLSRAPPYILDLNFFNHPILRAGFMPSANGHFSARALAKLYGAVANDGFVDGIRILAAGRAEKMRRKMFDIEYEEKRAWGAGLTLFDAIDGTGKAEEHGVIGHSGIGGSIGFAVPSQRFSMAVTLNKLNAISVSSAMVIAVVCKTMGIPMPSWHNKFAKRVVEQFKEGDGEMMKTERELLERILNDDEETGIMKVLIG